MIYGIKNWWWNITLNSSMGKGDEKRVYLNAKMYFVSHC